MLFHPAYFAPIQQYVAMSRAGSISFEVNDYFEKQTYRNRCYIYTEKGKQLLSIPIKHTKGIKQISKDVRVDYSSKWNTQHLKTLYTAYSSSPFFEFYIDDLHTIFKKEYTFLIDISLKSHELICDALELKIPHTLTTEYIDYSDEDCRNLIHVKQKENLKRYIQVFEQKEGFIPNLSILDLLFMEGPNTLNYLENQHYYDTK